MTPETVPERGVVHCLDCGKAMPAGDARDGQSCCSDASLWTDRDEFAEELWRERRRQRGR